MSVLPNDNTLPELLRMEAAASEELDASNSSIPVMRDSAFMIENLEASVRYWREACDALNAKASISITAKENVNGWTMPMGGLSTRGNDDPTVVLYEAGDECVELNGFFDADTLTEISQHMRSTQK